MILPSHELSSLNNTDQRPGPVIAAVGNGDAARVRRIAAPANEIRSIGLADGSVVTLDTASVVQVALTPDARHVTLLRGRARFTVAHDGRSFTVFADGGSVTARGTIFDVTLSPSGQVDVALLRGVVDVAPVARALATTAAPPVHRLLAGDAIGYANGSLVPKADLGRIDNPQWAEGAADFDNVSLGYLLDRANQRAAKPITVADPSLGMLRVSGRFKVGDTSRLADNLAALFELRADVQSNAIVLRRE
jgi:transmembrane sensor